MMTPKSMSHVPPGGYWVYIDPETKKDIRHPYYAQCSINAIEHRKANNLPIGSNWDEDFAANVCSHAATGVCVDETPVRVLDMMSTFARAAYFWAKSGFACVTDEQHAERKATCSACPYWQGESYFGYGKCSKCGCSALKLFWKSEKCPIDKWKAIL
jgi:hypothetical protein